MVIEELKFCITEFSVLYWIKIAHCSQTHKNENWIKPIDIVVK